jgi:hypothetical protein
MPDGFHGKIHIKIRPIEVIGSRPLDFENFRNRCLLEPREFLEGNEVLFAG